VEADACRPLGGRLAIGQGHSLVMTDASGRLQGARVGYLHHQTRFLSQVELRIDDRRPVPASASVVAADQLLAYFVLRPKGRRAHRRPAPVLEVIVRIRIGATLRLSCRIANHSLQPLQPTLAWRLNADFIDQSDLEIHRRRRLGPVSRVWSPPHTLTLRCESPALSHATRVGFGGPAAFHDAGGWIVTRPRLAPQSEIEVEIEATPLFDPRFADELPQRSQPSPQTWTAGCATLEAANATVQAAWTRAAVDLRRLQLGDGQGEEAFTPAAGFPHYLGLFGRDAMMTGWQVSLLNPAILRGGLSLVGRWTATTFEPECDAQPGRVLHQRQLGPLALLGRTPFLRYYGDHSASALFLLGLARAYAQSGDREWFLANRELAQRILDWMDRDGDADGDGLYEYRRTARGGLKNQGWKDSDEAIVYPDGRLVSDPIVVCEIQAIFSAAKSALSAAFRAAGDDSLADRLKNEASAARGRFNEAFWMEDEGFVALGLDPRGRQIRTLASNAGECLAYGVLDADRARRVAERLMRPDLFSGWGIRTLSSRHPAYNPLGYHLGSVWPCFTALTARGLARHGLTAPAHTLARALFEATLIFEGHRLPEVFGGHPRDAHHPHPGLYPNACSPQAWSAGAVILLVDTLVGLKPAAPMGAALLEPKLPDWLPEVVLRNVALGAGRIDFRVWREPNGASRCEILSNTSGLRLVGPGLDDTIPPPAMRAFVDAMP
jgi:glycogen debranching enzyme